MTTYKFTTPVVAEGPSGQHRLFYFYKLNRGISVIKNNGVYSTGRWFNEDQLAEYDDYWIGGHEHIVNEATKAEMIAANIGITESNFVAE